MGKERIPRALREQVWIKYSGKRFQRTCWVPWCKNTMTCFDFHVGHNIPESKGGTLDIHNLRPICSRCNLSMSDSHTISEWMAYAGPRRCFGFICGPPPDIPERTSDNPITTTTSSKPKSKSRKQPSF
jgi:hypothetical protein